MELKYSTSNRTTDQVFRTVPGEGKPFAGSLVPWPLTLDEHSLGGRKCKARWKENKYY